MIGKVLRHPGYKFDSGFIYDEGRRIRLRVRTKKNLVLDVTVAVSDKKNAEIFDWGNAVGLYPNQEWNVFVPVTNIEDAIEEIKQITGWSEIPYLNPK